MNSIKELKELSKNFRILYAEDEPAIRRAMHDYLSKFFLEVVSVENGKEGLEAYKKGKFDILITDLSMPVMNGIVMLEKIKEIDSNQAVLVTSAHSESEYMVDAIRAGINGYIIKPFDFLQLNKELFKIVEKLSKYKENENYKSELEVLVQNKTDTLNALLSFQSTNYEKTIYSMVEMIEDRDTYTAGHSKRVAQYAKLIALEMGCSKDDVTKLYQAGILHDVGKIATPDAVLLNPKTLNDLEYKLIQEHVSTGAKLIKNVPMFEPLAEIIGSHHERYDGKGYPHGLKGDEIIPLARIMIVADAFDAMTTSRIYKARKSVQEALDELEELKNIQFDSSVVDAARVALKNISIEKGINQLPKNELEEERFAYFYKDTLTDLYNKNYLELLLVKNSFESSYEFAEVFYIKEFSSYNKEHSWSEGDEILKQFALELKNSFKECLLFRVFGDDFVVICHKESVYTNSDEFIKTMQEQTGLKIESKRINLLENKINTPQDLENI